jgi:hypothetical protein
VSVEAEAEYYSRLFAPNCDLSTNRTTENWAMPQLVLSAGLFLALVAIGCDRWVMHSASGASIPANETEIELSQRKPSEIQTIGADFGALHGALEPANTSTFGTLSPFLALNQPILPPAAQPVDTIYKWQSDSASVGLSDGNSGKFEDGRSPKKYESIVESGDGATVTARTSPQGPAVESDPRVGTFPLSAVALADQRARAARYGSVPKSPSPDTWSEQIDSGVAHAAQGSLPRAFDASEGTALDPLLNKTYDLSYDKIVPTLK